MNNTLADAIHVAFLAFFLLFLVVAGIVAMATLAAAMPAPS